MQEFKITDIEVKEDTQAKLTAVKDLPTKNVLFAKEINAVVDAIKNTATALTAKENKTEKGIANGYAPLNEFTKLTSSYLDIVNDLVTGGATALLSAEQGKVLKTQIDGITSSGNSSGGIVDIDYIDLINLGNDNSLIPGTFYAFNHYHRNYFKGEDENSNMVYDDPTPEILITQALSPSKLSEHVRSITFPHDEIMYRFQWGSVFMGMMLKRVDKIRNITMYFDWRKAKFWNHKTSQLADVLYGGQDFYKDIYIGSGSLNWGYLRAYPVLLDSYSSSNIHINQVNSPLYIESSRNVRIDNYRTEYNLRSFVSLRNVQINELYIDANSNVLNEVLIDNVISCSVNINNNSGASTTVADLVAPTISI